MPSRIRAACLLALLVACLAPAIAGRAQGSDDVRLQANQGVQRIVLDVPVFPGDAATDTLLRRVIRDEPLQLRLRLLRLRPCAPRVLLIVRAQVQPNEAVKMA